MVPWASQYNGQTNLSNQVIVSRSTISELYDEHISFLHMTAPVAVHPKKISR